MAFMTIGGTQIHVSTSAASEAERRRVGSVSSAYAGNLRSTTRAKKRVWKVSTTWLLIASEVPAIEALDSTFQTLSGDIVNNTPTSVFVTVGASPFMARGKRQQLVLTLQEA